MSDLLDRYERALRKRGVGGRVTIAGSGVVSGGVYEKVTIAGSGVVDGDLEAESVSVSGSARFEGDVSAEKVRCAGSCRFSGSVKAESARFSGATIVEGELSSEELKVAGSLRAGRVKARDLRLSGSFRVGDVEAGWAEFRLSDDSEAGLVKATDVTVKSEKWGLLSGTFVSKLFGKKIPVFRVSRIEAENIVDVEGVVIEGDVYAKKVVLRRGGEVRGNISGSVEKE